MKNTKTDIILNAPGLVGHVAKYIDEVSYKVQPILSVASAIVAVGAIYGHRLRTRSNLRTNVLIFALAPTGSGKDGGRKAIMWIFDSMSEDFRKMICGVPKSAPGLLAALYKAGGVGLFLLDEIGHFISGINGVRAPSHTIGIMSLFTELFTSASETYRGGEYSDRPKDSKPRTDISQPCACVLGSSTPDRVYKSITPDDICDGFLPRWLVLDTDKSIAADNPAQNSFEESSGPRLAKTIIKIVNAIKAANKDSVYPLQVLPNEQAKERMANFKSTMENLLIKSADEGSNMQHLYSRANEHMEKLALIACEFKNDEFFITEQSVEWAIAVVEFSLAKMESVIDAIATNAHEQAANNMFDIIQRFNKDKGKMPLKEVSNRTRGLKPKQREELLNDLISQERIVKIKENGITYVSPV
jgi:hypothetical protein